MIASVLGQVDWGQGLVGVGEGEEGNARAGRLGNGLCAGEDGGA